MTIKFLLLLSTVVLYSENIYSQANSLRFGHYNIGQLSMGINTHTAITPEMRNIKWKEYKDLIEIINADIFGVCEYSPCFSLLADGTENNNDLSYNAIFSKYRYFEVNEKKENSKNCNFISSKRYKLLNSRTVPFSMRKGDRNFLVADISFEGRRVVIVETHLDTPPNKELRYAQIKELINYLKNEDYVIIGADFNVASPTEYDQFAEAGYNMASHGRFGDLKTFPNSKGGACLDNIICKGFEILDVMVIDTRLSDHFAIACDLILNK